MLLQAVTPALAPFSAMGSSSWLQLLCVTPGVSSAEATVAFADRLRLQTAELFGDLPPPQQHGSDHCGFCLLGGDVPAAPTSQAFALSAPLPVSHSVALDCVADRCLPPVGATGPPHITSA